MTLREIHELDFDPYEILGVSRDSGDEEIKAAYKKKPEDEQYKKAYRVLKTERERIRYNLLGSLGSRSIDTVLQDIPLRPDYKGPEFWYNYMKKGSRTTV